MVGTMKSRVTPSRSVSRSTSAGSKRGSITWVPPSPVRKCAVPQPLTWNNGIVQQHVVAGDAVGEGVVHGVQVEARCDSTAPFGRPVEPDV